jgi:hypothetical protein
MLRNGYALIVSAPATQVPGVLYWIVAARTAARIPAREPLHRRLVRGSVITGAIFVLQDSALTGVRARPGRWARRKARPPPALG